MNNIFCTLLALLLPLLLQGQSRYHVHGSATGQNNGLSWADAFTDLHAALALAQSGDEVWVAGGTYRPTGGTNRDIYFTVNPGVRLYGGFSGTEGSLAGRDWAAHPTVLDGDIGVAGDSLDNSRNLMVLVNPDSGTVLDGLVFRHAQADGPSAQVGALGASGAALLLVADGGSVRVEVRNCGFEKNYCKLDGGAVYAGNWGTGEVAPLFRDCYFTANHARRFGTAVALYSSGTGNQAPDFYRCQFERNIARAGGILYLSTNQPDDTVSLVGCHFERNFLHPSISAATPYRVAISIAEPAQGNDLTVRVDSSVFLQNTATNPSGHSLMGSDPNSLFDLNVYFTITNSLFDGNVDGIISGDFTGAVSIPGMKSHLVRNCRFRGSGEYFMLFPSSAACEISYVDIVFDKPGPYPYHRVYFSTYPNMEVSNVSVRNNTYGADSVVSTLYLGGKKVSASYITLGQTFLSLPGDYFNSQQAYEFNLSNSILDFRYLPPPLNGSGLIDLPENTTVTFRNNLCSAPQPSYAAAWSQSGCVWGTDPQLSADLVPLPCSPAVNGGDSTWWVASTDLRGQPRVQQGQADMGAVELGGLTAVYPPTVTGACAGGGTGSADLSGSSEGCWPLAYAWSHAPDPGGPLLQAPAGTYTATVTDARGRTGTVGATIPEVPPPAVSASAAAVACGSGTGGSAWLSVSGTPPFAFAWAGLPVADSVLSAVAAGQYAATVTDGNGCTAAASVTVGTSGALDLDFVVEGVLCAGDSTGTVMVWPQNAAEPYTFAWYDGSNQFAVVGLPAGSYAGTLTDAWGCHIEWTVPLDEPPPLSATAAITPASGPGAEDGGVSLSVSGGTGGHAVVWSNGAQGAQVSGLAAGTYTATVTDGNGCTAVSSHTVGEAVSVAAEFGAARASVWPNPFGSALWFGLPGGGPLTVCDALGRTVWAVTVPEGGGRQWADTSRWPPGLYVWHWGGFSGPLVRMGGE